MIAISAAIALALSVEPGPPSAFQESSKDAQAVARWPPMHAVRSLVNAVTRPKRQPPVQSLSLIDPAPPVR